MQDKAYFFIVVCVDYQAAYEAAYLHFSARQ